MKKHIVAVAALCLLGSGAALAQDFKAGDLLVRARAVHLDSANKDSTGLNLAVNDKWLPEVDFTYFLSPNLAAELILTVPQKHTLTAGAAERQYDTLPRGATSKGQAAGSGGVFDLLSRNDAPKSCNL